jgi:putative sterol carrier protein
MGAQEQEQPQFDPSVINVDDVPGLVGSATEEQLNEMMTGPLRDDILAEIFKRMAEHFKPGAAADIDAVIHWKVTGRSDGGEDHWETVIKDGKCTTSNEPQGDPRVTLATDGANFLKLVTNNANGPLLFMSGKLKVQGDIPFSARIPSLFTIPSG